MLVTAIASRATVDMLLVGWSRTMAGIVSGDVDGGMLFLNTSNHVEFTLSDVISVYQTSVLGAV